MKKLNRVLLVLFLSLLVVILPEQAEAAANGTCGKGVTWVLDDNGTLTISGKGEITDPTGYFEHRSEFKKLVLKDGITGIGYGAFANCSGFTGDLIIPDSVTAIGNSAFSDCIGFDGKLVISKNVTYIDDSVFYGCSGFTGDLIIPGSVKAIARSAFADCTGFNGNLVISDGVKEIAWYAFSGCSGFAGDLVIPDSVTYIGTRAFADCTGFKKINYGGTCCEWAAIAVEDGNEALFDKYIAFSSGDVCDEHRPKVPFADIVKGTYYFDSVLWAVDKEITTGISANEFSPDGGCTRGQVVTFLWRAAGCPEPETTVNPFEDVFADKYYYKAVLWAVENEITKGISDISFAPNDTCTRGQIVTFLYRTAGSPEINHKNLTFTDVDAGSYYAVPVLWAVENNITNGISETSFSPMNTCTRGQIVTFLYRYYN